MLVPFKVPAEINLYDKKGRTLLPKRGESEERFSGSPLA